MRQLMSNAEAAQEISGASNESEVSSKLTVSTQDPPNDDTAYVEIVNDSE